MTHVVWLKRGVWKRPGRDRGRRYKAAVGRRCRNLVVVSILSERNKIVIYKETVTYVLPCHFHYVHVAWRVNEQRVYKYLVSHAFAPACKHTYSACLPQAEIKVDDSRDRRKGSTRLPYLNCVWNNCMRLNTHCKCRGTFATFATSVVCWLLQLHKLWMNINITAITDNYLLFLSILFQNRHIIFGIKFPMISWKNYEFIRTFFTETKTLTIIIYHNNNHNNQHIRTLTFMMWKKRPVVIPWVKIIISD